MNKSLDTNTLADMAFDNALTNMKAKQDAIATNETIKDGAIEKLIADFEDASQIDENGTEYWDSRVISLLLEYTDYRNFLNIVEKAKIACINSGQLTNNHFVDVNEMVEIGSGAYREIDSIRLTRYACYLIAQNGNARKKPIAFAQTYFAIQTRRQQISDDNVAQYAPMSEDQKRLLLRNEIKEHNKNLASAAKNAGVIEPLDFAIFQTFGYKGLYGGLDRVGIQRRKGLRAKQNILDYMGSTELAANLFRATQTEEKLKRDKVKGKNAANNTHYEVGQKVRQAIKDIGGTMPENLPVAEDIAKVGRKMKKAIESSQKKSD